MKKLRVMMFACLLLLTGTALSSYAQDAMMMEKHDPHKPTVAIIRADWCPYCKQLEPTMMGLMKDYQGKLNFVMFDVTDKVTTAKAAAMAKSLGLSRFFSANKNKTSTIAIYKNKKSVFKTVNNQDRSAYVAAFDKAIGM